MEYLQKIIGGVIFIFFTKKNDFRAMLQLFTASVRSRPREPPAVPGVLILQKPKMLRMAQNFKISINR